MKQITVGRKTGAENMARIIKKVQEDAPEGKKEIMEAAFTAGVSGYADGYIAGSAAEEKETA